ncbi:hypothetical protein COV17_00920 [Candidatus Woesearchaeota archaeon CG10_big_fil_rev_8_21_14_0_10_36_11]|nr:MAG: hypothetical protein COV17_00920 [Candidatus Woesearchaeota archaeon CG10_big_fil_rev_8_21_14_0_10_36_11]
MKAATKRGQAASAAVLVAIIAIVLIGFVILLPPADRAELLGEGTTSKTNTSSDTTDLEDLVIEKTLLEVTPGRIDYLAQDKFEHPLPVVTIYTQTESRVLAEKNRVYAKEGVFSEEVSTFPFAVPDVENTKNIILSFVIEEITGGRLVISLNGEEIYNAVVEAGSASPIILSKNYMSQDNTLTFSVTSPGIAFWKTNEVSLKNVQVVADVTSIESQSSRHVFLLSETEKNNLERVTLKFQPECVYDAVGKLTIAINGHEVYNGIPDCDIAMIPLEISLENVYQGENKITFSTEHGMYILSHITLDSNLKEVDFPTYYFELSHEEYTQVQDKEMRVRVRLDFVDVVTRKTGDVIVNGHIEQFDTKDVFYAIDISDDVEQGNNAVKIKPKKTVEVRKLDVDLVK